VPRVRSVAVTTAFVVVGGLLLETGTASRMSISSSASDPTSGVDGRVAAKPGPVRRFGAWSLRAPDITFIGRSAGLPAGLAPASPRATPMSGAPMDADLATSGGEGSMLLTDRARAADLLRAQDPDAPGPFSAGTAAGSVASAGPAPAAAVVASGVGRPRTAAEARKRLRAERLSSKHLRGPWRTSRLVTWYGPGFYGNVTACGQRYTRHILGVAHRTLPCGTLVQFRWHGRTATAPVIDRGPYGPRGLLFDWSAWLACKVFRPTDGSNGCFTRQDVDYRVVGKVDLDKWFGVRAKPR
jgi:hypothetical protein